MTTQESFKSPRPDALQKGLAAGNTTALMILRVPSRRPQMNPFGHPQELSLNLSVSAIFEGCQGALTSGPKNG